MVSKEMIRKALDETRIIKSSGLADISNTKTRWSENERYVILEHVQVDARGHANLLAYLGFANLNSDGGDEAKQEVVTAHEP
jgi:hypothetical protein